jgi:hypothetical protein
LSSRGNHCLSRAKGCIASEYKLAISILSCLDGKTIVLTNEKEIVEAILEFQKNTKQIWYACVDSTLPSFSVGKVKEGYVAAKKRGVKIRYITEITKGNLEYCMEIMNFAELRHLDGVKGNFAVSDTEYVSGIKKGNSLVSLVKSTVVELVQQQRLVFETLWNQSIPAAERMSKIKRPGS